MSGLITQINYSVLLPESNSSSETPHTPHSNLLDCESTCKHHRACMNGVSCPVLWDGSEQNQTDDLGFSEIRYLFIGSKREVA